jgi:CRP-like cAMP-binding protein
MELPAFINDLIGKEGLPTLEEAHKVFSVLQVVKVRKNQILLPIGEIASSIYIVKSGILKESMLDEDGNTMAIRFVSNGDVMTSVYSFINQQASVHEIACLEDGELLCFNYPDFQYMSKLYECLSPAFYKLMLKRCHLVLDEKSRMITRNAQTRYDKFIEQHHPFASQIPLKDVASFLGITQQSLSRLRTNKGR